MRALRTKSGTPGGRGRGHDGLDLGGRLGDGLSWSSMLAPTTPTPIALRTVSAASPYPPSRSAETGSEVAATMRRTSSIISSTRDVLAVLVAARGGDRVAGRGERAGARQVGDDRGADRVPDVDDGEQGRGPVQAEQGGGLLGGGVRSGHARSMPGAAERYLAHADLDRTRIIHVIFGHSGGVETSRAPAQVTPDLRVRAKNIDAALVGGRIKLARQRAGLTQGEAAGDQMSTAYISRIEAGQRRASAELLVALANRLGCDPEELLAPDEDVAAREHVARLTLDLDYAELDLRTGQAESALSRVDALLAEPDLPHDARGQGPLPARPGARVDCGQLTPAIKAFEDVLVSSTDALFRIRALLALSRCYREEGDLARACEIGDRAAALVSAADLEGSAEGIQLAVTVAAAHFERGDVNHALRMCERAVRERRAPRVAAGAGLGLLEQQHRAPAPGQRRRRAAPGPEGRGPARADPRRAQHGAAAHASSASCSSRWTRRRSRAPSLNFERAREEMGFNDASPFDQGRNELGRARCRLLIGDAEEAERLAEDCFERGARDQPDAQRPGADRPGAGRSRARRRRRCGREVPPSTGRARRRGCGAGGGPAVVRAGQPAAGVRSGRGRDRGVPAGLEPRRA